MNDHVPVTIVPFDVGDAQPFQTLNRTWLVSHGLLEQADEKQLADPDASVFSRGGEIFMARLNGETVGCCAAIPHGDGVIEVAKLAVAPSAQGRGIGRKLVHAALRFAQERQCRKAFLTSSTKLTAALKLYESLGFKYRPLPDRVPYATVNVYMELDLAGWIIPPSRRRSGQRATRGPRARRPRR